MRAAAGETVTITSNTPPSKKKFDRWNGSVVLEDANATTTTFVMPAKTVTVTATFKTGDKYELTVVNGTPQKRTAFAGEVITITANTPADHELFDKWTGDVAVKDPTSAKTMITMLANAVTATANYRPAPKYAVTVVNGTADKSDAYAGETVTITADEPASGMVFDKWSCRGVALTDASAATTTFVMPAHAVTSRAVYKKVTTRKALNKKR
ncbi:MAG: hypothetical protein K5787_18860 [Lentisphaeria bacterium]|nr:hypothetical protein [Lentisphaeria bacterium]